MDDRYPSQPIMERVFDSLAEVRDIIDERPTTPVPPSWSEARGWTGFLLGLTDTQLEACEISGLGAQLEHLPGVPTGLRELGRKMTELVAVPRWSQGEPDEDRHERLVSQRKLAQIDRLVEHARELAARSSRLVDFGCGRGHLTRMSAESWDKPALGIEAEQTLVHTAAQLAVGYGVSYLRCDAQHEPPALLPGDLAMGLHACGQLGDLLIQSARTAGAKVLLVSCCPQKRRDIVREPLSQMAQLRGLRFHREVLGLANLTHRKSCLAAPLPEVQAARQRRYAVGLLLQQRGLEDDETRPMRGLSRRRSYHDLASLAETALARCGQSPPSPTQLAEVEVRAAQEYATVRRLGLPRNMLARLFELSIVLDRAATLHEAGYLIRVAEAFDNDVSPRNLALWGEIL